MTTKMASSSPPPPPQRDVPQRDTPTIALPAVKVEAQEQPSSLSPPPVPSFAENDPLPAFDLTPLPQQKEARGGSVPPPPPRRAASGPPPAASTTPAGAFAAPTAADAASPARTIPAPGIAVGRKDARPSSAERALSFLRSLRGKLAGSSATADGRPQGLLHTKVAGVPVATLIGSTLFLAAVIGVGVRYGLRDAPQGSKAEEKARASEPVEAKTAALADAPAASKLDAKAPTPGDETSILLAQAERLLNEKRDAEVAPLIDRALARKPELKTDARIAKVLRRVATSEDRLAAAEGFAMLTGPMGEVGAEVLYEISLDEKVRKGVRQRADGWLHGKEFERSASLPLYAAVKLRSARTCEAKQSLLEFAADAGDAHVLTYLRELEKKTACSPDDLVNCYPCMRSDSRLENSIAKLSKRLGG
jgi:hypothetical protein